MTLLKYIKTSGEHDRTFRDISTNRRITKHGDIIRRLEGGHL